MGEYDVAFWWVNHKQTQRAELQGDFLWSPLRNKNGAANRSYENMALAREGDIVFSYANGQIRHFGIVTAQAFLRRKPDFGVSTSWGDEGWMLPLTFQELPVPIFPKAHIDLIRPELPTKYSPLQASGNGNQGTYLAAISDHLGNILLNLGAAEIDDASQRADNELLDDLKAVETMASVSETERERLAKARVGQGIFRQRVLEIDPICRVTGVSDRKLLRASHIKPWRDCSNEERLDGANGLMLSPHIDLLFDRHLITFEDDGNLFISPSLDPEVLSLWKISSLKVARPLTENQAHYMEIHRKQLARGAAKKESSRAER